MNTIKKIMFMSSNDKNNGMGILKLERKNNNTFCNIKTYNNIKSGTYILGLKLNNKIIKQNINLENNFYSFLSPEIKELEDLQGCVLIELQDGEFKPILWGNNKDKNYKANIINSLRQSINNISNSKIKENKIISNNSITHNQTQNNKQEYINNTTTNSTENNYTNTNEPPINNSTQKEEQLTFCSYQDNNTSMANITNNNISNKKLSKLTCQQKLLNTECVYHPIKNNNNSSIETLSKISLEEELINNNSIPEIAISCSASNLFESSDDEIENTIDNELKNESKTTHEFYNMIKEQLDELFDRYPPEENLNKLIDHSSWVKISTDIVNKYYVVGIIKHNEDIKYICYGVPGNYNIEPPIEMRDYSQWLPTDITDPYNNGYWVMYQDSDTGENIFIN